MTTALALCSIDGCDGGPIARGLCDKHYRRLRRHGDPLTVVTQVDHPATCTVDGCDRPYLARGLCGMHYKRVAITGELRGSDAERAVAGSGCTRPDGYRIVRDAAHPLSRSKGIVFEHRQVLFDAIGPGTHACHWCGKPVTWREGITADALLVDHLDGDRSNNDPANLVPSCNPCNASRHPATTTDPYAKEHRS